MTEFKRYDFMQGKRKIQKKRTLFSLILITAIGFIIIGGNSQESKKVKRFQFENLTARQMATVELTDKTLMQSLAVDEVHQQMFVSQVKSGQTDNVAESFVITRCTLDGRMLDSMTLKYGGHGTNIGVEVTNDDTVYIWSSYERVNGNNTTIGHDLVRFKYKAGATYTPSSRGIENYSNLIDTRPSVQVSPTIDSKNRRLAVRQRDSVKQTQWVDIYDLDDIINHSNRKVTTIEIPEYLFLLQGLSLDGNYLYWRTGDTNERNYKDFVSVFDIKTGQIIVQKNVTSGWDSAFYKNIYREPEGIFMYTNPITGEKMLLVGIVTGEAGEEAFINRIYAFRSLK